MSVTDNSASVMCYRYQSNSFVTGAIEKSAVIKFSLFVIQNCVVLIDVNEDEETVRTKFKMCNRSAIPRSNQSSTSFSNNSIWTTLNMDSINNLKLISLQSICKLFTQSKPLEITNWH